MDILDVVEILIDNLQVAETIDEAAVRVHEKDAKDVKPSSDHNEQAKEWT